MFEIFKSLFAGNNNSQLKEALKDGAFLVDVRTPSEFSGGSVNGAVNIPLDKVKSQLAKFKGKKNIVVFCRSGNRSGQAQRILIQSGFRNTINGGTWRQVNKLLGE